MSFQTVVMLVLAVLVLFDLVLTYAVIRRLREHEERLSRGPGAPDVGGPPLGSPLPTADATAVPGTGSGGTVLGFFSTSCRACTDQAPVFSQKAGELVEAGVSVIAVLTVTGEEPDESLSPVLAEHAQLVVEQPGGPLTTAVSPRATPSFFRYDADGRLVAKDISLDRCLAAA